MAAAAAGQYVSEDSECPICMANIGNQPAVISRCCRHKFCFNCIRGVQSTAAEGGNSQRCPYCRSGNFAFDPVTQQRRQQRRQVLEPMRHPQIYRCQAPGCRYSAREDEFLAHLVERHRAHLLENHHLLFSQPLQRQRQPRQAYQGNRHPDEEYLPDRDPQLAENRKTYCGGLLNGPPCACCPNGVCGPRDGCNCVHCMTIDLANFQVTHGNSLVNKFGRVASMSSENGLFYCLGIIDVQDGDSIVYCGPVDGPNCSACSALDQQCNGRYASLM